jgi:hypothetical protein
MDAPIFKRVYMPPLIPPNHDWLFQNSQADWLTHLRISAPAGYIPGVLDIAHTLSPMARPKAKLANSADHIL